MTAALGLLPLSAVVGWLSLLPLNPGAAADGAEPGAYASMVEQYRRGDDRAVTELLAWKSGTLAASARKSEARIFAGALIQELAASSFPAAVMLHTEAGLLLNSRGDAKGASAQWLVAQVLAEMPASQRQPAFLRAWYRALGCYFLGSYLDPQAVPFLESGRERFPDDPEIALALARTYEMRGTFSSMKMSAIASKLSSQGREELPRAESLYRDVLARDPERAEARLRLGRVLQITARFEEGLLELRRVETTSSDRRLQYLAYLFAGQQLRHEGHLPEARQEFAHGLDSCPEGQAAALGLAEILHMQGERAEATSILARAMTEPGADPFRAYYFGDRGEQRTLLESAKALARGRP